MGFLAPSFLVGAAAVGLPLYLHLLRRHTTIPRSFSSLMFFERRTQSSVRHRRLRYLLLLAFRLALLVLLALAFANPYIKHAVAHASGDKLTLLVIDNSFSMRAGSRLLDAKHAAIAVLNSRSAAERTQIAALGSQLQVLTQPIQDASALRSAVDNIEPGDSRGSFGELDRAVRSMRENVHVPIELHLFSDMQKSDMPADFAEMALPNDVTLVLHPVVKSAQPNWAVESVNAPSQVWDPKKAHVAAVVAGYGTPAAVRTVSLVVNGKTTDTRKLEVPADGRASVEFQSLNVPYGFSRCEVRIDSADSLQADDAYLFAVERSDPRHVLFVHESRDTHSELFFGSAMASAAESYFALDPVTVERLPGTDFSKYAFVVLSDVISLPAQSENDLLGYVRRGGSVLVAAGASTARRARIPVFGANVVASHDYSRDGARFLAVGDADSSYPSMHGSGNWAGVKFYYAVAVDPADSRVIARLTDQTPLLLDKAIGEGHALFLASGLDNLTNDLPTQPVFVPFVNQTALYLSGTEDRAGSRLVDSFLELRTAKEQAVGVEIIDPAGHRPLSLTEAASAQSYQLTSAGFYQVRLANGREELVGVNADRRESNLALIDDDVLALWRGKSGPGSQPASVAVARQDPAKPDSLWWYAMLVVLMAAVGESLVAARYIASRTEDP
jgi:Aerotolerance regulator N-terminal/von Willebrand factor type A domain